LAHTESRENVREAGGALVKSENVCVGKLEMLAFSIRAQHQQPLKPRGNFEPAKYRDYYCIAAQAVDGIHSVAITVYNTMCILSVVHRQTQLFGIYGVAAAL